MSQENLEIVRALLRAYDRGDYEAALEGLDPEIEWHAPPGVTIGQEVYRGRMEVEKGFAEWQRPWDSYRFELEEMLDHGDHVVVCGMQVARGRGSGVEVRLPTYHVVTLRDGKITRHRSFQRPRRCPRSRRTVGVGPLSLAFAASPGPRDRPGRDPGSGDGRLAQQRPRQRHDRDP